jgi:hypothetical protein
VRRHLEAPFVPLHRSGESSKLASARFHLLCGALAMLAMLLAGGATAEVSRADTCPNEEVRQQQGSELPECRAWEQVSPVDKGNGEVFEASEQPIQAALDGNAIVYPSYNALAESEVGASWAYLSNRTATGWATKPISPLRAPHWSFDFGYHTWFSDDLSREALTTSDPVLAPGAPEGYNSVYMRNLQDGSAEALTTVAPPNVPRAYGYTYFPTFAGTSADYSHSIFEAADALTPEAPPSALSLYERTGGQLRLVGIRPDGSPDPAGSVAGSGASYFGNIQNAISDDGEEIFWQASSDQQLFVRLDGTSTDAVSASQASTPDPNGPRPATFWCASNDGSAVYFTSSSELTDDANTGADGSGNPTDAGNDLYRYDVSSGVLKDMSVATDPADDATGAAVQGVLGCSDDGEDVYFAALGKLAPGATSGEPNLYALHGGTLAFVAPLTWADSAGWSPGTYSKTAAVSEDGRTLAFMSSASIGGYDNTDANTGAPDSQVYVYHAASAELRCASCRADGSRPVGPSMLTPFGFGRKLSRGLTADGSRIFFESKDALVNSDTNRRTDVYASDGKTAVLISDGRQDFNAQFMDASADGGDIFFMTRAQLLPADRDEAVDAYDARVGGGFLSAPSSAPCSGDTCQGDLSAQPGQDIPATQALHSPVHRTGVRRCGRNKHKVRRHGRTRCVKHHKKHHRAPKHANTNGRVGR